MPTPDTVSGQSPIGGRLDRLLTGHYRISISSVAAATVDAQLRLRGDALAEEGDEIDEARAAAKPLLATQRLDRLHDLADPASSLRDVLSARRSGVDADARG